MAELKDKISEKQNEKGKNSLEEEIIDEENKDIGSNDDTMENELLERLSLKEKECEEYLNLLKRTKAEFDNFRKRVVKEKESLYDDGFSDGVKQFLPVLDNLERALSYNSSENDSLFEGLEMVLKIFKDTLSKIGVEEISDVGCKFDPDFHNAVMHIEDENLEENVIVEVLQKGYKYKNKILRYSMVKVAN